MNLEQRIYRYNIVSHTREDGVVFNDCWRWALHINPKNGYGYIKISGKMRLVHRESYKFDRGILDCENQVNHICDNRPCINPLHLYEGDQIENMADCVRNGSHRSGTQKINKQIADLIRSSAKPRK